MILGDSRVEIGNSDWERFAMVQASAQQQTPTQIDVVLNWFEELKQRVPTGQ